MTHKKLLEAVSAAEGARAPQMPRCCAIFAHPDDETVGMGARLRRLGQAHLIHVTDGAPRNGEDSRAHGFRSLVEYREARERELGCALDAAGIAAVSRECLGVADQEAALHLENLTRALAERLEDRRPEIVITHPYEGGHPDPDACAFAVHYAAALVARARATSPLIVECAFYHAGPHGIETGCFLPGTARPEHTLLRELSPEEAERKRALFACFPTQAATLQYFDTGHEVFRIAPAYDFKLPPHAGAAFYDGFPWGLQTARFCELAAATERALNLSSPRMLDRV